MGNLAALVPVALFLAFAVGLSVVVRHRTQLSLIHIYLPHSLRTTGDGWGADPVLLSCSASRGISSGVFPDRAIWEPFSARLTRLTLSWKLIRVRLRTVSLVEVQQNRRFGTSRRTSASFPEKGRSETPDRVRRPPGNMASGRVWRAKPAILLHAEMCIRDRYRRIRSVLD